MVETKKKENDYGALPEDEMMLIFKEYAQQAADKLLKSARGVW